MEAVTLLGIVAILAILILLICACQDKRLQENEETRRREVSLLRDRHATLKACNVRNCSNLLPYPIYYINLKASINRRQFIEDSAAQYSLNPYRIEAVNGKEDLSVVKFNNTYFKVDLKTQGRYTNFEVACTLSHIKAIYTAYHNGDEVALILEDDASFGLMPTWKTSLKDLVKELSVREDWDILRLFSIRYKYSPQNNPFSRITIPGRSAVAYLVSRKGMEKLLSRVIVGDTINLAGKSIVADTLLFKICDRSYDAGRYPYFYTYNDSLSSTIHASHDDSHISYTNDILDSYFYPGTSQLN